MNNNNNNNNNNTIGLTPNQSHEDLVAQLIRQSPQMMSQYPAQSSMPKTASQLEFDNYLAAHAHAQAQAMMKNSPSDANLSNLLLASGAGGFLGNNNSNTNKQSTSPDDKDKPPRGIPKVASLDMLRTMFFQTSAMNGGMGFNPFGGSNQNLQGLLGQQLMQQQNHHQQQQQQVGGGGGFTPPNMTPGKPGRPKGSTKNNTNAAASNKGKGKGKGAHMKATANDGLDALAIATTVSDGKKTTTTKTISNNNKRSATTGFSGGAKEKEAAAENNHNKKSKPTSNKNNNNNDVDGGSSGGDIDGDIDALKNTDHIKLGDNEEDDDPEMAEIRRQRRMLSNRESARRSRRRKLDHVATLENQIQGLQREQAHLLERYRQSEEAREAVFRENLALKTELSKFTGGKVIMESSTIAQNPRNNASADNLAAMNAGAMAAAAMNFSKQNSGSISNFLMSAGPSNLNLADGDNGMLRIPSMPRFGSSGDLMKRIASTEDLTNAAAGGGNTNISGKEGIQTGRGFVPFRPTSSYQNLLEAARLAEESAASKKKSAASGGGRKKK
jgi:hypothetical protein